MPSKVHVKCGGAIPFHDFSVRTASSNPLRQPKSVGFFVLDETTPASKAAFFRASYGLGCATLRGNTAMLYVVLPKGIARSNEALKVEMADFSGGFADMDGIEATIHRHRAVPQDAPQRLLGIEVRGKNASALRNTRVALLIDGKRQPMQQIVAP
ncbi:MAG: hypothetical protein AB7G06_07640 [Bdellovibrionales bacterium]